MSLILYTGLMGSGKSYSAIENVLLDCLKKNRTVVTNMVLKKSVIYDDFPNANIVTLPDDISLEDRSKYFNLSYYSAGAVFIIDEAGELFPSGERQSVVDQHVKQFFTKHRHSVGPDGYSSEIILMTQDASQLGAWVRSLVDSQYNHVKLDKHGLKKVFRVDIYDGAHTGSSIPERFLVKSATGKYKPHVFKYYKSHTQNTSTFESGLEEKVDNRAGFMHVYRNAILAIIAVPFLAYFAYKSLGDFIGTDSDSVEVIESQQLPGQTNELSPPGRSKRLMPSDVIKDNFPNYNKSSVSQIPESEDFRLVGILRSGRSVVAMIRSKEESLKLNGFKHCKYDPDYFDYVCIYQDKLVTKQTGPVFSDPVDNDGPKPIINLANN